MFTISQLMTRNVVTLHEDDALDDADALLARNHIRHLPVVRRDKLVGLVTHRDLLRHCRRKNAKTGRTMTARDAMTRGVTTVGPDTPVREAIDVMLSNRFGCLPVTTTDGTLVGIVTESDLLRVAAERVAQIDRQHLAAEYE